MINHNLRKGLELNEVLINTLIQQDSVHQSYAKVLNYLGYRMRTKKEIRDYLIKNEVDEEQITEIIHKLLDQNLLDDEAFASSFVNTRINTTTKGPGIVKQELMQKGVSARIATRAVEKYTYGIQYEKAEKIAAKRLRKRTKNSFTKQIQQLQATLLRNGFTNEVITDVIADVKEEKSDDEEWEAIVNQGDRLVRRYERKFADYELHQKIKEGLYRQGFAISLINTYLEKLDK